MTDAIVSEEFYDEFHWDDYGAEAPTAATVRYWRYTTAGGKEYLQSGFTFAAATHDFTATSLGSGGFSFTLASLPTGFQGRRIHREARATGPLSSYPVQPWDGYATANDEDDAKAATDALQADFDAFEVTNQAEHDATQSLVTAETDAIDTNLELMKDNNVGDFDGSTDSLRALRDENKAEHDTTQGKVDQIGAAAEARLTGPTTFEIPDGGSSTFVLRFVLRDLDQSPSALVDPDSNQVDVTVIDQSGTAPTGVTLAGTPAGRMARDSAGRYSLVVTVASTASDETQLRFTADYAYLSTSNVALHDVILGDFDQLDRIESNTDTLLTRVGTSSDGIDDPTLFGQHFDTQADIAALNDPSASAIADAVWDEPKADHIAAGSMGEEVQSHATPDEVNAQADIALADYDAPTKAEMDAFEARMQAEHDSTQSDLAALNDPSAAEVADAVWDEAISGHVAVGSFGEEVQSHATPTEVKTQADAALTDYDPPTRTEATVDKDEVKAHVTSEVDAAEAVIQAHRDEVEPEIDELVSEVGDEADTSAAATLFGRLKRGEENVDAEHSTTRDLITTEANQNQALIEDIQAGSRLHLSWSAIGDAGDEGGRFRASVAIADSVAGDISSANIDISAATVTLERSRAGAAFSSTGITQPSASKANGLVTVDFDLVGSEWKTGDTAHLLLRGVKATDSSSTARFLPANSWTFQVNAAGGFEGSFGG